MDQDIDSLPVVLYVDDIQANLLLFEASFDDTFRVILANSGNEALEILKEEDVHVIVSDQNMPGITGNELLEIVTVDYPDVMRFMITAYTDYDTVVEAINKGHLYGFFNKPYNIEDVKQSIFKALEVRSLRIKNREMIAKLEKANDTMLSLDRSKTKFLKNVADEIRVPINKIMTTIHMIKDKLDSNELTELLGMLDFSVRKLEGFSDLTEKLVRLNEPDFVPSKEEVSLKEIAELGIIENGNAINSKRVFIQLADPENDVSVKGEFDLLLASFTSLLDYCLEFTDVEASMEVKFLDEGECSAMILTCMGHPIPEGIKEELKKLESKDEVIDHNLGLEIILVDKIIKAHGGRFLFSANGIKCQFTLQIPS